MSFKFHFQTKKGWINDPNGLTYLNGEVHAFYQHNPYSTKWDKMHWGHAVSKDLISWEEKEIALYPDKPYENTGGCFSGSGIVYNGKHYLVYTAVSEQFGQAQCLAVLANGKYHKFEANPMFCTPLSNKNEFRDPKVFTYNGKFYAVIGASEGCLGLVLLYSSKNLTHWKYEGVLYATKDFGGTLECPDLFKLGKNWVLTFSAIYPTKEKQVFLIGDFNGKSFSVKKECYPILGTDFYAGQTFDLNKDRIIIGWLYHHGREVEEGAVSAGAFSIPCRLKLNKNGVNLYPVKSAQKFLQTSCDLVSIKNGVLKIIYEGKPIASYNLAEKGIDKINKIEYLLDEKILEIFINGGQFYLAQWLI